MAMIMIALDKRRKDFVRHQRSIARQPDQIAVELNQTCLMKTIQLVLMLGAQIDAEDFAVLAQIDAAHHSHSQEQFFRTQISVA